jgi:UDP-N-acetylglucosamine--N-acetylmuramyl-(pentapeptide) pyrophosphoryl-undecaprenol N-acetylglucosamine transferase
MSTLRAPRGLRPAPAVCRRRIAIAAGGTAGHVSPALAFADAYRQLDADAEIVFFGAPGGCEARLVPRSGHRLETVAGAPLFRVGIAGKTRAAGQLARGFLQSRRRLRAVGARLAVGFGGYASAGVMLAARSLGLRTAIHESNVVPGLTNLLLSRVVDRVCLGYEDARGAFRGRDTAVTGNPIRGEIAALRPADNRWPGLPGRAARVLIIGGSGGSLFLNRRMPDLLRRLAAFGTAIEARHQGGASDLGPVRAAYAGARVSAAVVPYIDDMSEAYGWADFVVTQGGAATLAELAHCGLPALIVPLADAARNHQTANAIAHVRAGGGRWVSEGEWSPEELAQWLASLLRDPEALAILSQRVRRLAAAAAAAALVTECERSMAGRW